MGFDTIRNNTAELIASLPQGVSLVAAGKTRTPEELRAAVEGGVRIVGHNYVQEAERSIAELGDMVRWHFIGHLQRNKAKKAARLFDMVETIDSVRIGAALDRACGELGRIMPVLVEVNSAEEETKSGVLPDEVEALVRELAGLANIRVEGLMTMGPFTEDVEVSRPSFRLTRQLYEHLCSLSIPGVEMGHLSMGMSDSYGVAIEEGATMVRIGTRLFGPR
jgi:pyridoxal phosphate enzyme (YggS family)